MEERDREFERFKDVKFKISFILGGKKLLLGKVIKLKEGDLIELDKKIDDYLEVRLNGQPFGIGELIVVNEKLSLRLVDLV